MGNRSPTAGRRARRPPSARPLARRTAQKVHERPEIAMATRVRGRRRAATTTRRRGLVEAVSERARCRSLRCLCEKRRVDGDPPTRAPRVAGEGSRAPSGRRADRKRRDRALSARRVRRTDVRAVLSRHFHRQGGHDRRSLRSSRIACGRRRRRECTPSRWRSRKLPRLVASSSSTNDRGSSCARPTSSDEDRTARGLLS